MNMLVYLGIFVFKAIEEALRTLHIIVVSNGKKWLGAIVQFFVAIIWIVVTGTVIVDIKKDPFKILFYALGSLFGSYLGSTLEEKIALGTNMFMAEIKDDKVLSLIDELQKKKYSISKIKSGNDGFTLLMITGARKKANDIVKIISKIDKDAVILSEKVKVMSHK